MTMLSAVLTSMFSRLVFARRSAGIDSVCCCSMVALAGRLSQKFAGFSMDASTMRCLITAGPTREHLDPVRFLSNGSSGKMGYALAAAAVERGWEVELVSGPVELTPPEGVRVTRVVSAQEMFEACAERFASCDVFIAVAAVADYRPVRREAH